MTKRKILIATTFVGSLLMAGVVLKNSTIAQNFSAGLYKSSPSDNYKLVLNVANQATVAEVGEFGKPGTETNLITRNTNLGNPISIAFASGNGITQNGSGLFCQMPGGNSGWFANTKPLNGILEIKLTTKASNSVFVIDSSSSTALNTYSYSTTVPAGVTRTEQYTGSTSYTLKFDGNNSYFRMQMIGSNSCGVVSFEASYNCQVPHSHTAESTYIEHAAVPAFRGVDGNIAYKECPTCHKLFDEHLNEITLKDTITKSLFYSFSEGNTAEYIDFECAADAKLTLDIKLNDPETYSSDYKRVYICFQDRRSGWKRTALTLIKPDGSCATSSPCENNPGQVFCKFVGTVNDGYLRYSFDLSKISYETGYTSPQKICIYQWEHTSGNIEINTTGGTVLRGKKITAGVNETFEFGPYLNPTDIVHADFYMTSDPATTKFAVMIGNWNDYFGYFDLSTDSSMSYSGSGVSYKALSDGYYRCTFKLAQLTKNSGTAPTSIEFFHVRGNWTTASGYIDVSVEADTTSPVIGDIY